jgi:glycosyltransferase involved in cell wall biosynthesis
MPKVSVIIATHNRARVLGRAIGSVLKQSFDDFEIVVADDASTDDTPDLMGAMTDPRIRYIRLTRNQGVSNARNVAIANSCGELLAFLDDDDEWLPDKLRLQVPAFYRSPAPLGLVYSGYLDIDLEDSRVIAAHKPRLRGMVFGAMLEHGSMAHTSTVMVRSDCFRRLGGFDPDFQYGEDFDMWLRIAREFEVDYVEDCLTKVYVQPDGLTRNYGAIISGTELHMRRYQDFFLPRRQLHSAQLQRLGTFYCFAGHVGKGRTLFLQAIRKNPLGSKNYACLALSFFGSQVFRASYRAKDRLFAQDQLN